MNHADAMRLALEQAVAAGARGEVPVGAVVLGPLGEVLAAAGNDREAPPTRPRTPRCSPCGQAAARARRVAADRLHARRHAGALHDVRGRRRAGRGSTAIVYGAVDDKAGAVGSLWDVVRDRRLNHRPEVVMGVLAEECAAALKKFFAHSADPVSSSTVVSPSGRGRTPRKRVMGQLIRGFKSHHHRHSSGPPISRGPFVSSGRPALPPVHRDGDDGALRRTLPILRIAVRQALDPSGGILGDDGPAVGSDPPQA